MKLATFNINGIKARIDALPAWLAAAQPDVVCLQEIKSVDEGFPREIFEAMGYRVETHGQKSFNGVAILSKLPLEDVTRGLPGDDADEQARWIEATVLGRRPIRVCGLYLPNGNPVPGPKYDYKLAWMSRMEARAEVLLAQEEPTVFCGDYNVIPQDADAAKPELWTTFWDYQAGAWERNNGIRIDHLLLSPQAADLLRDCQIDKQVRAGDKPSDHVPIWINLDA
jgi:exodeoxyribonuclease-3